MKGLFVAVLVALAFLLAGYAGEHIILWLNKRGRARDEGPRAQGGP